MSDDPRNGRVLTTQTGVSNRRRPADGPRLPAIRVVAGEDALGCCAIYPDEEVHVGRDPDCELVLDHPSVSRRHARISCGPDRTLVLEDLGSTNGVTTATGPVTGPVPLAIGDVFTVGDVTLRIDEMGLDEIRYLERAAERLRKSTEDPLTGALGRRWLDGELPGLVARSRQRGERLSALFLDVDHFKEINDAHGHSAGDRVLAAVARILVGGVRETDRVVRYGGEEFVVLLADCDDVDAVRLAERLRAAIERHSWDEVGVRAVTASIGAATLDAVEEPAAWLDRADAAMYRAKSAGRNRVRSAEHG
jgi:diguanylate cyclase (GGDEF)-like protein